MNQWWMFFCGVGTGFAQRGVWFAFQLRSLSREREAFFAEQRARLDALAGQNQRRYVELRTRLGLPPEMRQ